MSTISISPPNNLKIINSSKTYLHVIPSLLRKKRIKSLIILKTWNDVSKFNSNYVIVKNYNLIKTYKLNRRNSCFILPFDVLFELTHLLHVLISSSVTIVKLRTVQYYVNSHYFAQVKCVLVLLRSKLYAVILSISIPYHSCYGNVIIIYYVY